MKKSLVLIMVLSLLLSLFVQPFAQANTAEAAGDQVYDKVVLRGESPLRWDGENNPLTFDESEGLWKSEPVTLSGGIQFEYKFVMDNEWLPGDNLRFQVPQTGEYEFYFDPSDQRKVDVRPATEYDGAITLHLTVPEDTPDWAVPTVATSNNSFNYSVTPLEREGETFTVTLKGHAGEELEYRYGLGDSKYREVINANRTATFTEEGTVAADTVAEWTGLPVAKNVSHNFNHNPFIPSPSDDVEITVEVEHYGPIDEGGIYFTIDGSTPAGARGEASSGEFSPLEVVETNTEDNLQRSTLKGVIPKQADGTPVKYVVDVWAAEGVGSQFADTNSLTSEEATEFAYYVENYSSPDWAKDAVIYHIFVDRFFDGNPENNFGVDPSLPLEEALKDWMGGDLEGVLAKLDYIEELGVDTIWLSPVFEGPYSHGYHPTDFMGVDPNFGTLEVLKELIDEAHDRDMKVIYDFVPNHTSSKHPFFQDALENGEDSPYYDWYKFYEDGTYETFYGIEELPQFNNDHPEARDYMLNEVVPFWLEELEFDGLRLDYAKGPSYSFWVDFRDKVKSIDPDMYVFGEVWDSREKISSYAGKLDGSLDFGFHDTFKGTFAFDGSMQSVVNYVEENEAVYHPEYIMTTFLDNHDLPRFLYEAGNNTDKLKLASFTQFMLPGSPVIYYGTEVGLSQSANHNEFSDWKDRWYREFMIWDEEKQDQDLLTHYQEIIELRQNHSALRTGDFHAHSATHDALLFERSNEDERLIVAVNKGAETLLSLDEELELENLVTGERVQADELTVGANSFAVYQVVEEEEIIEHIALRGVHDEDIALAYDEAAGVWRSAGIHLKNKQTVTFEYVINGRDSTGELTFTPDRGGKFEFVFDPAEPELVRVLHPSDKRSQK
ncbi:glycoside hydrolase family 13 protein [Alkalihalophilus pseudofirmus]|uniref:Glycoside hydrolase family 13 protein n=1 Tax=Alkalihalophilus pseudofirmus TaxID=79885 RepID=A0AAJ2NQ60_ALKPS|nr:glycoside hydrolase family 13 protein [Alkalihalophilus pseudofirmus]MDV2886421.1 glycoside hydrolase family 13 protein [Alkalihalophilus pseudofirmus]